MKVLYYTWNEITFETCNNAMLEKGWIELFGDSEGRKKEYLITVKGKEIAEKELIRLRELVGIASGIVGGTL